LLVVVPTALVFGLVSLYTFDVAVAYDSHRNVIFRTSYLDMESAMDFTGYTWLRIVCIVGIVTAVAAAAAFEFLGIDNQAMLISLGSIAAMGGPTWAVLEMLRSGASFELGGYGVAIPVICFAVAAVYP
jgi:hypothetical protein